jgi:type IV fimbrial biogenesis protein FimT
MKLRNSAKYPRRFHKRSGFSLIELMVVVAILGTLASLAGPSFSESIKSYRIAAVRDDLIASIQLARTEAVRRGVAVSLRRTETCAPATTVDWNCGWEIFVDRNGNGTRNANAADAALDDTLLQVSTVPSGFDVVQRGGASSLTVNLWGQPPFRRFIITPQVGGVSSPSTTTICINSGGRIRIIKRSTVCPV